MLLSVNLPDYKDYNKYSRKVNEQVNLLLYVGVRDNLPLVKILEGWGT